ncbi:unnamed protein product [Penicillium bialowiezense]
MGHFPGYTLTTNKIIGLIKAWPSPRKQRNKITVDTTMSHRATSGSTYNDVKNMRRRANGNQPMNGKRQAKYPTFGVNQVRDVQVDALASHTLLHSAPSPFPSSALNPPPIILDRFATAAMTQLGLLHVGCLTSLAGSIVVLVARSSKYRNNADDHRHKMWPRNPMHCVKNAFKSE